jgi:tetratricopeptide (TPR) repeat protein
MKPRLAALLTLLPLLLAACTSIGGGPRVPAGAEAVALTGEPLARPELEPERRERLEADLAAARARLEAHPEEDDSWIWVGRRLGYLGRYRDAVAAFGEGLERFPESHRLRRHRGHRHLTLRELDDAVRDLTEASRLARRVPDELEPDGAPNPAGIPRSTTRSNIEYHLGLALHLQGRFEEALAAYERCLFFSQVNDDQLCAATYWTVLTLWRLDRADEARPLLERIHPHMEILENRTYHRLLLGFRGDLEELELVGEFRRGGSSDAGLGYGLAAWALQRGRVQDALRLCREVVANSDWPWFGHLAAEAELARRR